MVTLVGPGGHGRIQLAVIGTELLNGFADGVWLVDLAPITHPELVSSVIAQTLGISQREGDGVDESIPPWLERKNLLLIFDNCEHVLQTVGPIVAAIVRTAADVRVLATSRQALGIGGDWSYDLLTPDGQRLFTRLGIFASGFTLDAATSVCGGNGLDELSLQRPGDLRGMATVQYFVGVALGNMARYDKADVVLLRARECARSAGAQYAYNIATVALGTTSTCVAQITGTCAASHSHRISSCISARRRYPFRSPNRLERS